MLQFLQSIWLWAAAGIIVPVIIHLWNVKQGKTLLVGSIAFLPESARSHAKSFKMSEWLLLLLRCLLLIVLAITIAKPFIEKQLELQQEKGWILIEKKQLQEAYKKFTPAIDTLTKSGYSFHYFNSDFKEAKLEEVLKMPTDTAKETQLSYWKLLTELDQKVPSRLPVFLFTDNSLKRFSGDRPEVSLNLNWKTFTSDDTTSKWLEKAFQTSKDSIRLITGNSNSGGTYYSSQNLSSLNINSKYNLKVTDGNTFIYNKNSLPDSVALDTATLSIVIYTDHFSEDAYYFKAAINAIKDFTQYKIKAAIVNDMRFIPGKYNWLFWLSEEPLPASKIKNKVLVYEKGKIENTSSTILTEDRAAATMTSDISLSKFIQSNSSISDTTHIIWKNGYGDALLNEDKQGVFHFFSHFNPQWNDLTWSSQFPQIIFDLLFNKKNSTKTINEVDKRIMDSSQIQPVIIAKKNEVLKQSLSGKKDFSKVFWLIAFVLFTLERILSFRSKKDEMYV